MSIFTPLTTGLLSRGQNDCFKIISSHSNSGSAVFNLGVGSSSDLSFDLGFLSIGWSGARGVVIAYFLVIGGGCGYGRRVGVNLREARAIMVCSCFCDIEEIVGILICP